MERYGGHEVKPGITSRCFPYSSLDQYILRKTRLRQIGIIYGISEQLTLQDAKEELDPQYPECECAVIMATLSSFLLDPTCVFFSPKPTPLEPRLQKSIEDALASRFGVAKKIIQRLLKSANVVQWGRVRVTDPDTDDMIWAAAMRPTAVDQREASYVKVSH